MKNTNNIQGKEFKTLKEIVEMLKIDNENYIAISEENDIGQMYSGKLGDMKLSQWKELRIRKVVELTYSWIHRMYFIYIKKERDYSLSIGGKYYE